MQRDMAKVREQAARLLQQGLLRKEVAARVGVADGTIWKWFGSTNPQSAFAHPDETREMWLDGHSASVIAEKLGVTRNAIIGFVKRARDRGEMWARSRNKITLRATARAAANAPDLKVIINAQPKPPVIRETPKAIDEPEPLYTMATDTGDGCRWICGDPKTAQALVCGHKRAFRAWCEHHARRVYQPMAKAKSASERTT